MANFQTKVIKKLESKGYLVLNVIRLSASGYPDLLAIKDNVNLWIECKELKDTLKPLQKHRIDVLNKIKGNIAICLKDTKGIIYPEQYDNELEKII